MWDEYEISPELVIRRHASFTEYHFLKNTNNIDDQKTGKDELAHCICHITEDNYLFIEDINVLKHQEVFHGYENSHIATDLIRNILIDLEYGFRIPVCGIKGRLSFVDSCRWNKTIAFCIDIPKWVEKNFPHELSFFLYEKTEPNTNLLDIYSVYDISKKI